MQITKLDEVIYAMLVENTGSNLVDSGGAYGRMYDRNRKHGIEDFKSAPSCSLHAKVYSGGLELDVTKSLFHHLTSNLHYNEGMNELWMRFDEHFSDLKWDGEDGTMNKFYQWAKKNISKFHDAYEFEEGEHFSGYTYNDDNILSQDFVYFIMGGWVFIQLHNGCDARWGFTAPKLFQLNDKWVLMEYFRYTIGCKNSHYWDFEGNYETTEQPMTLFPDKHSRTPAPSAEVLNADDVEFKALEGNYSVEKLQWEACKRAHELSAPLPGFEKPDFVTPPEMLVGKMLIQNGTATCPCCGELLEAWTD